MVVHILQIVPLKKISALGEVVCSVLQMLGNLVCSRLQMLGSLVCNADVQMSKQRGRRGAHQLALFMTDSGVLKAASSMVPGVTDHNSL